MDNDIRWLTNICSFQGRNGPGKCHGIDLKFYGDVLKVQPITSRGAIGNCWIDIPKTYLPELVSRLIPLDKIFEAAGDRLPTLIGLDPGLDVIIEEYLKKD